MEGTTSFAFPAVQTVGGIYLQGIVMRSDGWGDGLTGGGKIVEFVGHGDVDADGAGLTVAAVGTMTVVSTAGGVCQDGCVVPFFFGGCEVCHGIGDLGGVVKADHD